MGELDFDVDSEQIAIDGVMEVAVGMTAADLDR